MQQHRLHQQSERDNGVRPWRSMHQPAVQRASGRRSKLRPCHESGPARGKALAQAEAVCRAHGARLTPIRRKVLEALYATHKPLGAYDLAEILGPKGRRLAPITVYRALDFLIEQGLAHRLASQNAYIALPNSHDDQDLVAFLICEKCGGVDELASPGLVGDALEPSRRAAVPARTPRCSRSPGRCAHCHETPTESRLTDRLSAPQLGVGRRGAVAWIVAWQSLTFLPRRARTGGRPAPRHRTVARPRSAP